MSYLNAPSTRMLATHCAACGRPLRDAKSVEIGMGPDCREKYGYDNAMTEEVRSAANKIIHHIALEQTGANAAKAAQELVGLGLPVLADRILKRVVKIHINQPTPNEYYVTIPYSEEAVSTFRTIPGQWYDRENKCNRIPLASKPQLLNALNRAFTGETAIGPKGVFVVGQK
jgi:hypothetical protein